MSNTLYKSADLFSISDNAIASGVSSWTINVDGGAIIGVGPNATLVDNVAFGVGTVVGGSVVVTGSDLNKIIAGGTNMGKLEEGYYIIPKGGSYTEHIHGDAGFTTLRGGAADFGGRKSINYRLLARGPLTATALRANKWNQITGKWAGGYPATNTSGLYSITADANTVDGSADQAALPTSAVPGELSYTYGAPNPKQDEYAERFLW